MTTHIAYAHHSNHSRALLLPYPPVPFSHLTNIVPSGVQTRHHLYTVRAVPAAQSEIALATPAGSALLQRDAERARAAHVTL